MIAAITPGQSRRADVVPEFRPLLPSDVEILEKGALDGLTLDQVESFRPTEDNDVLVTRMRDGTEVTIGRAYIFPRLQKIVSELAETDVDLITLLCSGKFPMLHSEKTLLLPEKLLSGVLSSVSIKGKLGVLVPSERQVASAEERYKRMGFDAIVHRAEPWNDQKEVVNAAKALAGLVNLTVMDCFGYNVKMKAKVNEITSGPVILVRSLLARALAELAT